ncbi:hypothetical protein ACLKA6_002740 [Drosophila palustris]
MAIAYFIPDQAQLLARSNQQAAANTANPRENNTRHNQQQQQQQTQRQQQQQQPQQQQRSSQFRANISVPLGREQGAMTMSEFGCWELLAQIFCYALRLYSYNPAQRRPTVIQISFEISSGTSNQDDGINPVADGDVTDASPKRQ